MFGKLRNRLIWINLGITTVLIVVVFSGIWFFATGAAERRPAGFEAVISSPNNYYAPVFLEALEEEKAAAAQQLLILLVVAGVAIELIVALVSYYLAEEAIKPVREAYEAQKVFIANAAHEIKTPVAAIQANLEAAEIVDNRFVENAVREAEKLARLDADLLALAKTDAVSGVMIREVSVAEIVRGSLESFEPRLLGKEVRVEVLFKKKVKINVPDFEQVIGILVDNAVKYSSERILVTILERRVEILNDGIGIPKKKLEHVFERFYQVNKSMEGAGLGLSIAKATAERNGWKLSVWSEGGETKLSFDF